MKNPYSRGEMLLVESGSLADYFRNGGTPEKIFDDYEKHAIRKVDLNAMKIGEHARLKFEWPDKDVSNYLNEIQVWILKVDDTGIYYDDFRWFYSSEPIEEEKILRGLN